MVEGFGENPWEVDEREQRAARNESLGKTLSKIDQAALDPQTYFKGQDFSWSRNPSKDQSLATVNAFLRLQNGGEPLDSSPSSQANELTRQTLRRQVAYELFDGRGAEDDASFFAEIQKSAQHRADRRTLGKDLTSTAHLNALLSTTSEDEKAKESSWATFRETARQSPGYKPEDEADLYDAYHSARSEAQASLASYAPELKQIWSAMKQGPAGNFTQVASALLKDLRETSNHPLGKAGEEAEKKDAPKLAAETYHSLTEEERPQFMQALGTLARTLPKEEQAGFFSNLAKQGGRDIDDLMRNIASLPGNPDNVRGLGDFIGSENTSLPTRDSLRRENTPPPELLAARNFASDVRNIERNTYNPVKSAWGDDTPGIIERGLYGIPGGLSSSVLVTIPFVGQAAMFSSMEGSAYDDIRANLLSSGMSDADATAAAYEWSTATAVPQAALERLQANALLGKLPFLDKFFTKLGDKITSNSLRFATRTTTGAVQETAIEAAQDFIPRLTQDLAATLSEEIPHVTWFNGTDGALDGFWAQQATTFVTMLPLAIIGAAGGITADKRINAFQNASDNTLLALGASTEQLAELRAAQAAGASTYARTLPRVLDSLDPSTDTAQAATQALIKEEMERQGIAQEATASGILPRFTRTASGWTLHDSETGAEIGTAPNAEAALRLAQTHTDSIDEQDANRFAYLVTMLEAGDLSALSDTEDRSTTTDFRPGETVTTTQQAATSPEDAARVAAQVQLREKMEGGTGEVAQVVLGQSSTTFEQNQRHTVNRINAGASILTVFHEETHGFYREAIATGRLTRADSLSILQALDTILSQKQTREGQQLRLLPADFETLSASEQETAIDEAISELMESEVIRTRKGTGVRKLPPGLISRNLAALSRIAAGSTAKFRSFARALRSYFGIAIDRAAHLDRALKDGTLDQSSYNDFLNKLLGQEDQAAMEQAARDYEAQIINGDQQAEPIPEGDPFSIAPAKDGKIGALEKGVIDDIRNNHVDHHSGQDDYEIVAYKGEDVMGYLSYTDYEGDIQIEMVQVRSTHQRQGIATELYKKLTSLYPDKTIESSYRTEDGEALRKSLERLNIISNEGKPIPSFSLGSAAPEAIPDGDPFSIGRATITPEQDAAYLDLAKDPEANAEQLQAMVDARAKEAGYEVGFYHGSDDEIDSFDPEKGSRGSRNESSYVGFVTPSKDAAEVYGSPQMVAVQYKRMLTLDEADEAIKAWSLEVHDYEQGRVDDGHGSSWRIPNIGQGATQIESEFEDELLPSWEFNEALIEKANTVGADSFVTWDGADDAITLAFLSPSQIKSADPVTYDSQGNTIPLSQRFDSSKDSISYSLGSAALADAMKEGAIARIRDPQRRVRAMSAVARKMERIFLIKERLELIHGAKRAKSSLKKEAAFREASLAEQYENEAYARHYGILEDDDLLKIKSQPVHKYLSDPDSPLRGTLKSKSRAIKDHPDLFRLHRAGDYDGSDGVSRSVFGGTRMPDQAAQDLYDANLIKEPTADALWQALLKEQSMVASMKELHAAAKEDIRSARTRAKQEVNQWLAEQIGNQDTNFSPKKEVLDALALLDAILSSVSPEIRGKVGGYTQLAKLGSDEARLAFLTTKLEKVDVLLEQELRKQFAAEMEALLKRARPQRDAPGEKPKAKTTATVHDLFQQVELYMSLPMAEAEAEALKLESLAASEDITPEQAAHNQQLADMLRLTGDWTAADAARRESAVTEATRILAKGYDQFRIDLSRKFEQRQTRRHALKADTGKDGSRPERRAQAKKKATKLGRTIEGILSLLSFDQITEHAFGRESEIRNLLVDWERHASYAREDALYAKTTAIEDLFTLLGGSVLKGEKLRHAMGTEDTVSVTTRKGKEDFTLLEAISATLIWRQQDGRRHMEGHLDEAGNAVGEWGWTQADVDSIESQLTPEAKAVRLHLMEQYAAEYDRLNPIYRDIYGVNLPRNKFYSPLTVKPQNVQAGQVVDPVSGFASSGGFSPGSLKTRSQTAVAEPDFRDALNTYIGHSTQIEHFIAYAPFATEAMAIINTREVGNSVEAKAGKETLAILRQWLDQFSQGGNRDAAAHLAFNQTWNRAASRVATAALVGRVSVLAIQATQLGAALAEMPTGSYLYRFAKLNTGQLDWTAAIKSDFIQRRLQQMPPIVRQAMEELASSKPNAIKHAIAKVGETISGADALFTAGTYAIIFDYQMAQAAKEGLTGKAQIAAATEAAERSTERVAQPTRTATRSLLEVTSTNPAMRTLWAFASEPRQKLALTLFAMAKRPPAEKARAFAVTWIMGGVVSALIRAAVRDIRDNGEDEEIFDERNWSPKRLALSSLTAPLSGFPIAGNLLEGLAFKAAGEYMPEGNLFSSADGVLRLKHIPDWFTGDREADKIIGDIDSILTALAPITDTNAAAAGAFHIIKDAEGIIRNLLPD